MRFRVLTIVGVGLIGGSVGLAAKKRGVIERVVGVGRDPLKLDRARQLGAIDEASIDVTEAVRDADFVLYCTPVDCIAGEVKFAAPHAKAGAIVSDAGSTKSAIVQAVESAPLGNGVRFVGGHPLAGSEKKGAEYANADLFVGRMTVLTPTEKTDKSALADVQAFWESLGAKVRIMTPAAHDEVLAFTSHLPHLLAAALAGILPKDWRELTAGGFRDTTRVASGDPAVWTPIFQHNRDAVLAALAQLEHRLSQFRHALATNDVPLIDQFLTQGKKVRDALGS